MGSTAWPGIPWVTGSAPVEARWYSPFVGTLDWGRISSGETFEALVHGVVGAQDPGGRLLSARGPDAAIDALSGDGRVVYQAKHRGKWSTAELVREALTELGKIRVYRSPDNPRRVLWASVSRWVMVTDAERTDARERRWREEVGPAFEGAGIEALWWDRRRLETELHSLPALRRAFFDQQNRILLSLREARQLIGRREIIERGLDAPFVGRDDAVARFEAFLGSDDRQILPVHGPGGIGKTRLLWEMGGLALERGLWVWWAAAESMAADARWFEHLVPEQRTLLLLDEPEDPRLLRRLDEQLAVRPTRWCAVVATRTPKDPVMELLRDQRNKTLAEPIELAPLTQEAATRLAGALLPTEAGRTPAGPAELAGWLATRCGQYPIWIAVAVKRLDQGGDLESLPEDLEGIGRQYVEEVVVHAAPTERDRQRWREVIRMLALLQPVSIEDDAALRTIQQQTGHEAPSRVEEAIERLADRGFVRRRGRLREITPDVIRDLVLHDWLLGRAGRRSRAADELIAWILTPQEKEPIPASALRAILSGLARVELQARLAGTLDDSRRSGLLSELVNSLLRRITEADASGRLQLLALAEPLHVARPEAIARLSELVRSQPAAPTRFTVGSREIAVTNVDVEQGIPWLVTRAAAYALTPASRRRLLSELFELVKLESEVPERCRRIRPTAGQQASALLARVIHGEGHFLGSYLDEAAALATEHLDRLARPEAAEPLEALRHLIEPQLRLDRHRLGPGADPFQIRITPMRLMPNHPAARVRKELLDRLWTLATARHGSEPVRLFALALVALAHGEANQSVDRTTREPAGFFAEVQRDLERALDLVSTQDTPPVIKLAARRIWEWHRKFDKETDWRAVAEACEQALTADPALALLAPIQFADVETRPDALRLAADHLRDASGDAIRRFVSDAYRLFDSEGRLSAMGVCLELARRYPDRLGLRQFVQCGLAADDARVREVAAAAVEQLLRPLRVAGDQSAVLAWLTNALGWCVTDERRRDLIRHLYDSRTSVLDGASAAELELVGGQLEGAFSDPSSRVMSRVSKTSCTWSTGSASPGESRRPGTACRHPRSRAASSPSSTACTFASNRPTRPWPAGLSTSSRGSPTSTTSRTITTCCT